MAPSSYMDRGEELIVGFHSNSSSKSRTDISQGKDPWAYKLNIMVANQEHIIFHYLCKLYSACWNSTKFCKSLFEVLRSALIQNHFTRLVHSVRTGMPVSHIHLHLSGVIHGFHIWHHTTSHYVTVSSYMDTPSNGSINISLSKTRMSFKNWWSRYTAPGNGHVFLRRRILYTSSVFILSTVQLYNELPVHLKWKLNALFTGLPHQPLLQFSHSNAFSHSWFHEGLAVLHAPPSLLMHHARI